MSSRIISQIPVYRIVFEQFGRTCLFMLPMQTTCHVVDHDTYFHPGFRTVVRNMKFDISPRRCRSCDHIGDERFQTFNNIKPESMSCRISLYIPYFKNSFMLTCAQLWYTKSYLTFSFPSKYIIIVGIQIITGKWFVINHQHDIMSNASFGYINSCLIP